MLEYSFITYCYEIAASANEHIEHKFQKYIKICLIFRSDCFFLFELILISVQFNPLGAIQNVFIIF